MKRRRVLILYFLFTIIIFPAISIAQSYFTLFSSNYSYSSKNGLPQHNRYQSEAANLNLPVKLKQENKILIGLAYQRVSLRFSDSTTQEHFFSSGINLGFVKKTKSGSVLLMAVLRGNSDYKSFGSADMQYGGVVLVSRKKNDNFTFKYGLYANTEQFGPFIVPLLGLDWKLNEKFRIFGILPQNMVIENKVTTRFRWGLAYLSPTLSYHINSPLNLYLHQNQTRAGLFADVYLTKSLAAQFKFDYSLPAQYRVYTNAQQYDVNVWGIGIGGYRSENNTPLQELNHKLIFQLGINYRVEL